MAAARKVPRAAARAWLLVAALVASSAAIAGCGSVATDPSTTTPVTFTTTSQAPTSTVPAPTTVAYIGPDGVPIETGPFLAPAITTTLGARVDGIQCDSLTQLAYTAYAHLRVYVHGRPRALPGGIGLVDPTASVTASGLRYKAGTCSYWLHTRAADGVIEIQSPARRSYTLGDFFAIWRQPLGRERVAGARGRVTALVDGKRWTRSPTQIPLREHTQVLLAVGGPVPRYQPIDWAGSGL